MTRTIKGSKGPGWEPWSNCKERQQEKADSSLREYANMHEEDDIFLGHLINEEASESLYCHYYGPCEKCKARKNNE